MDVVFEGFLAFSVFQTFEKLPIVHNSSASSYHHDFQTKFRNFRNHMWIPCMVISSLAGTIGSFIYLARSSRGKFSL